MIRCDTALVAPCHPKGVLHPPMDAPEGMSHETLAKAWFRLDYDRQVGRPGDFRCHNNYAYCVLAVAVIPWVLSKAVPSTQKYMHIPTRAHV